MLAHDDANGGPFVEIQISTDVTEADPEKGGPRQRTVPHSAEKLQSHLEAIGPELTSLLVALGAGPLSYEAIHMLERRLVHPVQHDQL